MHFEFLIEDISGKRVLETLIPKIVGQTHTWRIHAYRGIGKIPSNLNTQTDPSKRILLQELSGLLRGYGKSFSHAPEMFAVIVVCDLDDRCLKQFRQELAQVLNACETQPTTRFCIAVEEGEAWLLGDLSAVIRAYPKAKTGILESYINDSICGTWELLADAICSGGAKALKARGGQSVGAEKSTWAKNITPYMQVENNQSPSFCYFRAKLMDFG
jgi:hypothetical protein